MLRRIPSTPLVCLVVLLSLILLNASWAAGPDESLDMLLKPNQAGSAPTVVARKAKAVPYTSRTMATSAAIPHFQPRPMGIITKVKPPCAPCPPFACGRPPCHLAVPRPGQWEIGVGALFAHVRGRIAWPRYSQYSGYYATDDSALWPRLTDQLALPVNQTVAEFSALYQFRPNWGIQFTLLAFDMHGGGQVTVPNNFLGYFVFGNQIFTWGQQIQSEWIHDYNTLALVYTPIQTCVSRVSISAGWVHVDDKINALCTNCGYGASTFSEGTDSAMVGLEFQKCLMSTWNCGSFSSDCKGAAIFLDDAQGWDVELGGRYTIPLNAGRWGYVKGGYRLVNLNRSESNFVFDHTLDGGFFEFGFIF